jgi:hypothetical protein
MVLVLVGTGAVGDGAVTTPPRFVTFFGRPLDTREADD